VKENGTEIYIDSKARPFNEWAKKVALYISTNEFALMETVNRYLIARVFNVTTTH
jgi:Fe-S cluster biosynthesis and repair protein YggX